MYDPQHFDVIVFGSGLAGLMAALGTAEAGMRCALVTDVTVPGGSSFSPATWGLGMVSEAASVSTRGPESLFKTLCDIGMGMNDQELSYALISRSEEAFAKLRSYGVTLLEPNDPSQREFVPCFDHRTRSWHGFTSRGAASVLAYALERAGVTTLERSRPLSLLARDDGSLAGALLARHAKALSTLHNIDIETIFAPRAILATGGLGGLFSHHLCSSSCAGLGHALALDAGAELVNLEFLQLMLGSPSPTGPIIFNEKLYRWTRFVTAGDVDAFDEHGISPKTAEQALEAHSWHGPYTSRLKSRLVDELLSQGTSDGALYQATLDPAMLGPDAPEFVQTYLSWLRDERHVDLALPQEVRMYAHSSNGGIAIDEQAQTAVRGLFACGECAGGVHGADRVGGLASMTAACFGMIAAEAAASMNPTSQEGLPHACSTLLLGSPQRTLADKLGRLLDESCMVNRCEAGLSASLFAIASQRERMRDGAKGISLQEALNLGPERRRHLFETCTSLQRLRAAEALVTACLLRRETRGPHHRSDCPTTDPSQGSPRSLKLAMLAP